MSESPTQPVRQVETQRPIVSNIPTEGMAKVLAVILTAAQQQKMVPLGPDRQITEVAKTTEQMRQVSQAMVEASKFLMPQMTRMTEDQLRDYSQHYVNGELVPFFAQLKDIEPSQRLMLKDNLKGLFGGCLDRWGDLNFDDTQKKIDEKTGASVESRTIAPLKNVFASAVEYADTKAQIEEILRHPDVANTTPIVKHIAVELIEKAKSAGLMTYHESALRRFVDEETRDPAELEARRLLQEAEDDARHKALVDALEARRLLRDNPPVSIGEKRVAKVTGQPLDTVLANLARHMGPGRSRNK